MSLLERLLRRKKRQPSFMWELTMPVLTAPSDEMDADGRHRDLPYLLPNDEQERQRLDYQHFLLRLVLSGNCFAPVHDLLCRGGNVLDVGCGTGKWGHELATAYPKARVAGFDVEDMRRTTSPPLNYQFSQGNVLNGLPFAAHTFDYVHQRLLVAGIPLDTWPWVVAELRRVTRPGGWIELVEMGTTFHHVGPATQQWIAWWMVICDLRGIDASKMSQIGVLLKHAGLCNIQTETKTLPVGSWGGRIGRLLAQDMLSGWLRTRPLAQTVLGVPAEAFEQVMSQLETEWNSYHTSYELYLACGQVESAE